MHCVFPVLLPACVAGIDFVQPILCSPPNNAKINPFTASLLLLTPDIDFPQFSILPVNLNPSKTSIKVHVMTVHKLY